jgi:hypothetical protein
MFYRTRTTGLENPQDSILPEIETALVPITTAAWKTAQRLNNGQPCGEATFKVVQPKATLIDLL